MTTITAPAKFTGETRYGDTALNFTDGVAEVDSLSPGLRAYLVNAGYTVDGTKVAQPEVPERVDARDVTSPELVGTALRDAAADPAPTDFLPPVGAGTADPHGELVASPGIHAEGERVVRPGEVKSDPAAQSAEESETAAKLLIDNADVAEVNQTAGGDWKTDTGPLGLSDPGSVDQAVKGETGQPGDAGEPRGNASREDWEGYARQKGAQDADLVDGDGKPLSRDDIRAKYGS